MSHISTVQQFRGLPLPSFRD